MKQFISLGMFLVILSSCGTETVVLEDAVEVPTQVVEQTVADIDTELANLASGDDNPSDGENLNVTVDDDQIVIDDGNSTVTVSEDGTEVTGEATITSDLRQAEEVQVEADIPAASGKVTTVQATYNNSKRDVVLDIEYALDDDGKISSVEVANTNGYDLSKNLSDGDLDALIGKSLNEVDDTYVSGGSLTTAAIKSALSGE